MSSMQNVSIFNQSMNGVITLSDGMGTTIENGEVDALNLAINGFGAFGESVAVGQDLAVGNNIVNSGNIITGKDIECSTLRANNVIANQAINGINLAINGLVAIGDSVAIGQDLAVGNNIVDSGSIITNSLVVNNSIIQSNTQAQLNYILGVLSRNNLF